MSYVRIATILATAVLLLGGMSVASSFAEGKAMGPGDGCWGCNIDIDGHHCFASPTGEVGKTVCTATPTQCSFSGTECANTFATLPSDGKVYLAATGGFALSDESTGGGSSGADGVVRICHGVIVERLAQSPISPLTLSF